jgi:hypothetical protein
MSIHGQHVETLVVYRNWNRPERLACVLQPAAALTRLKRLEVEQPHSLALLAPVLGRLPQLQHLAADVGLKPLGGQQQAQQWGPSTLGFLFGGQDPKGCPPGVFTDASGAVWQEVPHLQELCPQLTHLRLTLFTRGHVVVDSRLVQLLPSGLRKLGLKSGNVFSYVMLPSFFLYPATQLEQLVLEGVVVDTRGSAALGLTPQAGAPGVAAQALGPPWDSLQQLRLQRQHQPLAGSSIALQVAPKVTEFELEAGYGSVLAVRKLVNLRRLKLHWREQGPVPAGTGRALAALTGLEELQLSGGDMHIAVQLAAGLPTLRRLVLSVRPGSEDLTSSLGQCTQLTSLKLVGNDYDRTSPLEQLTGLRCLDVPALLLEQESGAWLAPLTALTQLHVSLTHAQFWVHAAIPIQEGASEADLVVAVQKHLSNVHAWPASLQQVEFTWYGGSGNIQPRSWRFGPTATSSAQFNVWVEQYHGTALGWGRPLRPCPHLPGVWELQGEAPGSS